MQTEVGITMLNSVAHLFLTMKTKNELWHQRLGHVEEVIFRI